ncbi:MAG: hypothetical protein H0W72_02275 [Planctomycetes bacterium]|uniref:hypothetical protein n=1 Tax=Methylibium sp. TaxID=2067992 RepID=UPI0017D5B031|nr:hypothetical protein [Methylibium sp.]MBA3591535.1 hypothetical protein [Methylibium sp.]MBA3684050.1 hypothetical protein [Planctomycetota bacterium]
MEQALATFGPWGAVLVVLLCGMRWVVTRLSEAEIRAESRASERQAHCDGERRELTIKVEKLEDRIADLYQDTLNKSTEALAANVVAFRRFCEAIEESPSGMHRWLRDDT